jgi:hypothetical protein
MPVKNKSKGSAAGSTASASLSSASIYEQTFGVRHRRAGRPAGDAEPVFVAPDVDPLIAMVAKRRAYAVVHEENKDRLAEVFAAELKVLKRRGVTTVARDAGVALKVNDETEEV